jgi:hypothetical protein
MTRLTKGLAVIAGMVFLIVAGWLAYMWAFPYTPSNIVDFHPTNFHARADVRFFYSFGDQLKNSDELNPNAPTLLRGEIQNFLVSPDGTKIAAVANGLLTIIRQDGSFIRQVAPVDSIYRKSAPIGHRFYRDDDFQWSRDSKGLYLINDGYYASKGSQLFSEKGQLWRYDVQTGNMRLILSPFPAYNYFFGNSGIYFSVPTDRGDLQLKYFDGRQVSDVDTPNAQAIPPQRLSASSIESPFFSFSIFDYQAVVLPAKGVSLETSQRDGLQTLEIKTKPYLTLTQGKNFKGPFYCSDTLRSVYLPGDRYFLFNVPYCGNYNGQLLIDTATGNYKRLPVDTRVYLTLNTGSNPHYRITGGGIVAK